MSWMQKKNCPHCSRAIQVNLFEGHVRQCASRRQVRQPRQAPAQKPKKAVPRPPPAPDAPPVPPVPPVPQNVRQPQRQPQRQVARQPMRQPAPNQRYGASASHASHASNPSSTSLWKCNLCTYQNQSHVETCIMCQQGKRPNPSAAPRQANPNPPSSFSRPQRPQARAQPPKQQARQQPPRQQARHQAPRQVQPQPKAKAKPPPAEPSQNADYWKCPRCTFLNPQVAPTCVICSDPKPEFGAAEPPKPEPKPEPRRKPKPQARQVEAVPQPPGPPGPPGPPPDDFGQNDYPMSANEADDATAELIRQMMAELMCAVCQKQQGFEGVPCGHKLCGGCVKKHLLTGIVRQRWKKEPLVCPINGCKGVIPEWLVKQCGLGEQYRKQIDDMQQAFLIASDPTMTQCPSCKQHFVTEVGDLASSINNREKGPDGKPLGLEEQKHKARWRFRCECKTIFCGGCGAVPYHLGYTCEKFKEYQQAKKCRFCEAQLTPENTAPRDFQAGAGLHNVCNNEDCLEKRKWSCDKILPCAHGHNCIGIRGERRCFPCLHKDCQPKNAQVTSDEFCNICWVDPLEAAPTIELQCGHYFHFMCVWSKIERKWPAARITFGFLNCPLCKKEMQHEAMRDMSKKFYELKKNIETDAIERLKVEGLDQDRRLKDRGSPYFNNMGKFAMDRLAFYMCFKCNKPYFGGMKACEEAGMEQEESYKREHLVCGSCASGPNTKSCKKHGKKYITHKCKFCCNVATWYCWGNTHFCDSCHKKQEKGTYLNRLPIDQLPKCPGPEKCPLGIEHPPNGTAEFSLGCVVCLRR